jgi:hypothetical protein
MNTACRGLPPRGAARSGAARCERRACLRQRALPPDGNYISLQPRKDPMSSQCGPNLCLYSKY